MPRTTTSRDLVITHLITVTVPAAEVTELESDDLGGLLVLGGNAAREAAELHAPPCATVDHAVTHTGGLATSPAPAE